MTEEGSIQILDRVEFGTNSDVILAASNSILTDVHAVLVASTQLRRVRVEGHTVEFHVVDPAPPDSPTNN